MQTLMMKLMLSCLKTTELVEKKEEAGLSLSEKIQLYFHTSLCDGCRAYQQQSRWLNRVLKKEEMLRLTGSDFKSRSLSPAVKRRILEKLQEQGSRG